ncbi:hypothetical protein QNO08_06455 [Arthrobacter sp. zg-Y820]|uniref:hypothetical protein n=1 Tax=unclassified Arthrobacter TaxID=235627 RepID=UPI001E4CFB9D|nr:MULTISPECIES: hypothetical protein [unclassified Arthrobacter]MCC9197838.1 hypothetical protein [Arthrobacter sp. zg-Y820]MDK1280705.1 hypothetical protein [Arthrobacter sp. zg.Y820]MDK1360953.1 hypothetical protein [Arthrobacter sp. zg-Y1219]WIB10663.1 hypothetical protein QNO08_06455 [Arthrobacter sp. zg-Y820]
MPKHAAQTRNRTGSSLTAQITAIAVGCVLVAGGVSAAEISILNNARVDASVSAELVS